MLACPGEERRTYSPKGPQLPAELWTLLLTFENAAINLAEVHACTPHEHSENKKARDIYKAARFALNRYLADQSSRLRGYESFANVRAFPVDSEGT
jgi:hypothetical protein